MKMETFVINLPSVEEAKQIVQKRKDEAEAKRKKEYHCAYTDACNYIRKELIPSIERTVKILGIDTEERYINSASLSWVFGHAKKAWLDSFKDFTKHFNKQQQYQLRMDGDSAMTGSVSFYIKTKE